MVRQTAVKFRREIRPVCLPVNAGDQYDGSLGLATGWGKDIQVTNFDFDKKIKSFRQKIKSVLRR